MNKKGIRTKDPSPGGSSPPAQSTGLIKPNSSTASPSPESSGRLSKVLESENILESTVSDRHVTAEIPATDHTHACLSLGGALRSPTPTDFAPRSRTKVTESAGNSGNLPASKTSETPKNLKESSFEAVREFLGPSTESRPSNNPKKSIDEMQKGSFSSKKDFSTKDAPQETLPPRPMTHHPAADGPWSTAPPEEPLTGSLWATADPEEDPKPDQATGLKPTSGPLTSWIKPRSAVPATLEPPAPARAKRSFLTKGGRSRSVSPGLSPEAYAAVDQLRAAATIAPSQQAVRTDEPSTLTDAAVDTLSADPSSKTPGKRLQETSPAKTLTPNSGGDQGGWQTAGRHRKKTLPQPRIPLASPTSSLKDPIPGKTPRHGAKRSDAPGPSAKPAQTKPNLSQAGEDEDFWLSPEEIQDELEAEQAEEATAREAAAMDPTRAARIKASDTQGPAAMQARQAQAVTVKMAGRTAGTGGPHPTSPLPKGMGIPEPSGPTPPTPAGKKATAKPSAQTPRMTPRENQAAKAARDEAEVYGAQGNPKQNIGRRSRAQLHAPDQADLSPTSWLARSIPPLRFMRVPLT